MSERNWDMYNYILESKDAVRHIVDNQDKLFNEALDYCDGDIDTIYLIGSGTSYHSSLCARSLLEKELKIKVNASYPIRFKDDELITSKNTLVIGLSQAGRSSSTIMGLDHARALGLKTIAITANPDKPIVEHADKTVLLDIGEEFAGPKTKGYFCSIVTIQLFVLCLGVRKGLITEERKQELIERMLKTTDNIPEIAEKANVWYETNKQDLMKSRRLIVIGYDNCLGSMMEGTLKLSEACRFSIIGYELEEFMHGIYHGIDANTYMLYMASPGQYYERCIRMKDYFENERHAHNYLVTSDAKFENDPKAFVYDFVNDPYYEGIEYIVPLQVLARRLSADLGIDCNDSSDPNFHRKMASYTY